MRAELRRPKWSEHVQAYLFIFGAVLKVLQRAPQPTNHHQQPTNNQQQQPTTRNGQRFTYCNTRHGEGCKFRRRCGLSHSCNVRKENNNSTTSNRIPPDQNILPGHFVLVEQDEWRSFLVCKTCSKSREWGFCRVFPFPTIDRRLRASPTVGSVCIGRLQKTNSLVWVNTTSKMIQACFPS